MKVYELLKELPHDKFMPLLLGVCETARSVAIEALSDTDIIAANGAEAVRQYATAVESRLAYISESDDLYARQENILLMRDKERLDSLLSQ